MCKLVLEPSVLRPRIVIRISMASEDTTKDTQSPPGWCIFNDGGAKGRLLCQTDRATPTLPERFALSTSLFPRIHGPIELRPHLRIAKEDGLQEPEAVGQVSFIAAGFAVPGSPVDSLHGCIGDTVLKFAAHLSLQHRRQYFVAACGIADGVVCVDEM